MAEHEVQVEFVKECSWKQKDMWQLDTLFAVPNAAWFSNSRTEAENYKVATRYISEGLKAGVPDLMLAFPSGRYHGLFIEFKYGKNVLSPKQHKWRDRLIRNGYAYHICYSCESALKHTYAYIKGYFELEDMKYEDM